MSILNQILLFTFIGSVVSLFGGILLLLKKGFAESITEYVSAFAAGTLLGTAFFDALPEALEQGMSVRAVLTWTLVGLLGFFLLQRSMHWFDHHHDHHEEIKKATGPLVMLGDALHNFIDGGAIAISFLVSPSLGIVTALAVGAHEIPHEIGTFGVLLKTGYSRKKVIWYNIFSAGAAFLGALLAYSFGPAIGAYLPIPLAITAGFFIYIAASDLIPEIHARSKQKFAVIESLLLITGVAAVGILIHFLE